MSFWFGGVGQQRRHPVLDRVSDGLIIDDDEDIASLRQRTFGDWAAQNLQDPRVQRRGVPAGACGHSAQPIARGRLLSAATS